jgi:serine protease Do
MSTRSRTFASFFTVAMAAMLVGAVVSQVQHPASVRAGIFEPAAAPAPEVQAPGAPFTLTTFRDIAKRVSPGVVNITSKKVATRGGSKGDFFGDDLMERFFGRPRGGNQQPEREVQRDLGSGFVIDKAGYILTNRHVIDDADTIQVNFADGKQYDAKLMGKDARTDVALLKIEPREALTVLELGDSNASEVGEWVMAIGNPFGLAGTVTVGVVSFKGRNLTLGAQGTAVDMIQTDASINPGNSGGPLLNTRGQVIGINTLIITQGAMQSAGVGFAVPVDVAKEILPQLRDKGKVVRGWLGIRIQTITEDLAKSLKLSDTKGAYVADITSGSPAEKAGVKPEDVVVAVDGTKVADREELTRYVSAKPPGTSVRLDIIRNGSPLSLNVTLGTFPEETDNASEESGGEKRAQLGMTLRNLTPDIAQRLELPAGSKGIVVTDVDPGSKADDAGIQRGDVIVMANGAPTESVAAFEAAIAKAKADGVVRIRARRGPDFLTVVLKLQ